jgi:hypothetical protein
MDYVGEYHPGCLVIVPAVEAVCRCDTVDYGWGWFPFFTFFTSRLLRSLLNVAGQHKSAVSHARHG